MSKEGFGKLWPIPGNQESHVHVLGCAYSQERSIHNSLLHLCSLIPVASFTSRFMCTITSFIHPRFIKCQFCTPLCFCAKSTVVTKIPVTLKKVQHSEKNRVLSYKEEAYRQGCGELCTLWWGRVDGKYVGSCVLQSSGQPYTTFVFVWEVSSVSLVFSH